jgi:hypothetical protein
MWRAECERRSAADLAAAGRVFTPQEVMERARYGEPTDTYTWNLVVARCLQHLAATGFVIVRAEEKPDD